jgi:hypothetical protein
MNAANLFLQKKRYILAKVYNWFPFFLGQYGPKNKTRKGEGSKGKFSVGRILSLE